MTGEIEAKAAEDSAHCATGLHPMQAMTADLLRCVGVPETRDQVAEKLGALMMAAACLMAEDLIRGGKDIDDGAPRMADWCAQQIMRCLAEVGPKLKQVLQQH